MRPAQDASSAVTDGEVIAFLSRGESYGLPGQAVELVETHCSVVFLVGEFAFKLKRPIAFSALDYTSVEKREVACRREVELNRRAAPDLYLGVRAIRRDGSGKLGFAGAGPAVDWVVAMRRFEQSDLFDHLAATGRLTAALSRELAEEIARFHGSAARTDVYGGASGLRQVIEHNRRDQLTVLSVLGEASIEELYAQSLVLLGRLGAFLDRRRAEGRVRLCHGDLRLANLCLYHGRPRLFDAIEFADEISCIDVLFDLAFLLMDLRHQGLRAQANVVLNVYLDATGDDGGLPALPLMMSIRAGTRAFAVANSSRRQADPQQGRRLAASAHDLMALGRSLLVPETPRLVVIGGGTETERRAVAARLAPSFRPEPGARVIMADGRAVTDIVAQISEIVAAGYTAVVAGSFQAVAARRWIADLAATRRLPLVGIWFGKATDRPPEWPLVEAVSDLESAKAAVTRLLDAAAARRDQGAPSPPDREADETPHSEG